MPATTHSTRIERFWEERVRGLMLTQLKQGFTPEKLALTIALGITLAVFPILGTTTLLCLAVGVSLKLNQPVIQLVNWLASPLQFLMIPVFVRLGEWIMRAQRVSFSIPELMDRFRQSPAKFLQDFGMTGVHGIVAWLVTVPFAGAILYFIFLPLMKKLAATLDPKTESRPC